MVTKLTEALLTGYYNRCNPDEPLEPGDNRIVLLDEGSPGMRLRGVDWVGRLTREITRAQQPICRFFSGLRGSGKSTELRRLAAALEGKDFLPILIDAEGTVDLTARIDVPDILALLLYHTERELLKAENKDPDSSMRNGAFQRFWDWISRTDIDISKIDANLKSSWLDGRISMDLKNNPAIRDRVREIVSRHISKFLEEVRKEFSIFDERAKKINYERGLVIILDSLEKLQGTSSNWSEVMASAETLFASGAPLLSLPVPVLYTFPPALTRRLGGEIAFLPMIKVRDRQRLPYGPGVEAARSLLRRRIPEDALKSLFGDIEYQARERELITWSGGYPRELVRLLQMILAEDVSSYPLSELAVREVLLRAGDSYAAVARATEADLIVTARIASSQSLSLKDRAELEIADRLMTKNIIFRYLNEEEWFDVHPAVLRLPEIERMIRQLDVQQPQGLPLDLSTRGSFPSPQTSTALAPIPFLSSICQFSPGQCPLTPLAQGAI